MLLYRRGNTCLARASTLIQSRGAATEAATQLAGDTPAANVAVPRTSLSSEAFGYRALNGLPLPRFIPVQVKEKVAPVPVVEAVKQVRSQAKARFDETVEIALKLGIDPRRGDQMVRGATVLPHGTGKTLRVCVFATDEAAEAAKAAGADVVGSESLIQQIQESGGSNLAFDKCIATPDMMPKLGRVARILGPRGLMPNPKLGTVTTNVVEAISLMKRGRVEFRAEKGGVVHAGVGKVSFAPDQLQTNIAAFAAAIMAARPKGVKGGGAGGYVMSATLSSTMGQGVPISLSNLVAAAQSAGKSK